MDREIISNIIDDLSKHKRDRSALTQTFIQSRLDRCVESYYDDIRSSYDSLKEKNVFQVFKKLNKKA